LSEPFAGSNSKDREAIHALANAQLSRSGILTGNAPMQEVIASTRAAIANYDRLAATAGTTPEELFDMANGYDLLGDELGIIGVDSLNDLPGALAAYRRYLDLNKQALSIYPKLAWARRGLVLGGQKVVEVEMDADPAQALNDALDGLQSISAMPKDDRESLPMQRSKIALRLDEAYALVQMGSYSEANEIVAATVQASQRLVAADPQDLRALTDMNASLAQSSLVYEMEADPALAASADDRHKSLMDAERSFSAELAASEKLIEKGGGKEAWAPYVADAQVNLGSIQSMLHRGERPVEMAKKGLATLRGMASKNQVSPDILDDVAQDFLFAEPAVLKDPGFAVSCAERSVALTHRRMPSRLLTLAQAYRAAGQTEKSRATAREGLALLPSVQPGSVKPRIRKLLEIQAQS
jgi:tetratricopeptide (TPR) repeat protein